MDMAENICLLLVVMIERRFFACILGRKWGVYVAGTVVILIGDGYQLLLFTRES